MRRLAAVLLLLWLILVFVLGARGAFVGAPGRPPILFALFQIAPVFVFLAACRASVAFREWVLSADQRLLAAIQGWRWMGFAFLAIYAQGLLPGVWAYPASLGDVATALAAPWICVALIRRPAFARSPVFLAWNLFGILDLVVAIGNGGATAYRIARGLQGGSMSPVANLPLALIPAFFVPIFLMLHLAALFQARRRPAFER